MTVLLVLLVLLPWSIWRQMQTHEVTLGGLVKLPLIFAAIGLFGFGTGSIPTDPDALLYLAISVLLSVVIGIWRGALIPIWTADDGRQYSRGNRTTLTLWGVLLASKFAMGTVASVTGWFPGEHAGEIFLFVALSFVAQNIVVARRITPRPEPTVATA